MTARSFSAAIVGACAALATACTPPPPPPGATRDNATAINVFTDSVLYRRYCTVAAGQPVDLERPCVLLDQSRPVVRPPFDVRLSPQRP